MKETGASHVPVTQICRGLCECNERITGEECSFELLASRQRDVYISFDWRLGEVLDFDCHFLHCLLLLWLKS